MRGRNNSFIAVAPVIETIDSGALYSQLVDGRLDAVCVLGPTASGKTRYAVKLAREFNTLAGRPVTEIISADSRQVYIGMDIGTGKDSEEYGEIPYHLTDILPAGEKYDIYRYAKDFRRVYADLKRRGIIPIVCGGSGLYIDSALRGYDLPDIPADMELRAELEKLSDAELKAMLADMRHGQVDKYASGDHPDNASGIRADNETGSSDSDAELPFPDTRKRLVRAIEVARNGKIADKSRPKKSDAAGTYPEDNQDITAGKGRENGHGKGHGKEKLNIYYIGIYLPKEERNARIDARLDLRLSQGMVEEVRSLLDSGVPAETLEYYGLEYRFVTQYLLGKTDYETMRDRLATAIHQFAKRQMTWFRSVGKKGVEIHWTDTAGDLHRQVSY